MLWQDPLTSSDRYGESAKPKSIFDPCPPGYCVPKIGTWDDIKTQQSDKPTTNNHKNNSMVRNFQELDKVSNYMVSYWPYPDSGDPDNVPLKPIYLPMTGYMNSKNVTGVTYLPGNGDYYIMYHSANPSTKGESYRKAIKYDKADSRNTHIKWWGYAIRCVTVRDSNQE